MKKTIALSTPLGPYSPALQLGPTLYLSGQIAPDEARNDTIEIETKGVLMQIDRLLQAAGFSRSDVVKCTVYLVDFNDFPAMNRTYESFFSDPKPTRTAIGVTGLPKHARVEIDAIAVKGDF